MIIIEKPLKHLKKEIRKKLQQNLIELRQAGYSWIELGVMLDEHINYLGNVVKHGEYFSIGIEKTNTLIDKTQKILNSFK